MDLDDYLYGEPEKPREEPLAESTDDFLRWLDAYWPHRCPEPGRTLEEIHRYAGARSLIDMLMYRKFGPDKSHW